MKRVSRSLRARWVVPVGSPPLENAVVSFADGVIVSVEQGRRTGADEDLGDVVLAPGCVNTHTHLEFSELSSPLGAPGIRFPDWVRTVVAWRRSKGTLEGAATELPIQRGIAESRQHGVTSLGEIATQDDVAHQFRRAAVGGTVFRELLGISSEQTEEHLATAKTFLQANSDPTTRLGLSPHAPYTINRECLARIAGLSADRKFPLAMHLAESHEELELLATNSGPLVDLLKEWGAWDPGVVCRGMIPKDYLTILAAAHRTLVIHGNYLSTSEIGLLARHRSRMSVVYCPRTHRFFGHDPYPLQAFLQANVVVALGTDSRGSNPDLSIYEEMRELLAMHPALNPADVLRMGTLNGARALGQDRQTGSLEVGKRADIVVVASRGDVHDPYNAFFAASPNVLRVYSGGTQVVGEQVES